MKKFKLFLVAAITLGALNVFAQEDESSGKWIMTCSHSDKQGYLLDVREKDGHVFGSLNQMTAHGPRRITEEEVAIRPAAKRIGSEIICGANITFKKDLSQTKLNIDIDAIQLGYQPRGKMDLIVEDQPNIGKFTHVVCEIQLDAIKELDNACRMAFPASEQQAAKTNSNQQNR